MKGWGDSTDAGAGDRPALRSTEACIENRSIERETTLYTHTSESPCPCLLTELRKELEFCESPAVNGWLVNVRMETLCRPRVFVYRLPESYRDPGDDVDLPMDGIGAPVHAEPIPPLLFDTDQYSLASLVHERALAYHCRTHNPAEADLFVVPAFRPRMRALACAEKAGSKLSLLRRLQIVLPNATTAARQLSSSRARHQGTAVRRSATAEEHVTTIGRRGGADHVFLNPRNGEQWDSQPYCELHMGAPSLGAATYLSMEAHPHNGSWVYPEGYCGKVCVDAYRPQLVSEQIYWSVPWPSTVHVNTRAGRTPPWASEHPRPLLAACHFNLEHKPILPRPTIQLRQELLKSCQAHPTRCTASPASASGSATTALLYWRATFCLQPGGDTVTRKGIVDAILLGCIPVLFHRGQLAQWPWHWGRWVQDATVLLNQSAVRRGDIDAIEQLAAIPAATVAEKRRILRRHAHRMQYSALDTAALPAHVRAWAAPDAFDLILRGAWHLSRNEELQALGRHLQRTKSGGRELSARRWQLSMGIAMEHVPKATETVSHWLAGR